MFIQLRCSEHNINGEVVVVVEEISEKNLEKKREKENKLLK